MRILIFNWRDAKHPKAGGAETYTHEIASRLVKAGNEVTLFTAAFPGAAPEESIDGVKIIRQGGKASVYCRAWKYYNKHFNRSYDILVDQVNTIPFFTPLYAKGPYAALLFQMTGNVYKTVFPWPLGLIAFKIEPWLFRLYSKSNVIVISESIKQELEKHGFSAQNITVIKPGVDSRLSGSGPKTEEPTVLFMNRIIKYKNVDHLLKAFATVRCAATDAKLFIGGCRGTKYESKMQKLTGALGLSESVVFYPFLNIEKKREMLQRAWVHVLPSTKEGWGLSVLEAGACGTPSVAYDVPGLKDAVINGETGILVPYNEIDTLAAVILEILDDYLGRETMGKAAMTYARTLSWDASAAAFATALENFVSEQA